MDIKVIDKEKILFKRESKSIGKNNKEKTNIRIRLMVMRVSMKKIKDTKISEKNEITCV